MVFIVVEQGYTPKQSADLNILRNNIGNLKSRSETLAKYAEKKTEERLVQTIVDVTDGTERDINRITNEIDELNSDNYHVRFPNLLVDLKISATKLLFITGFLYDHYIEFEDFINYEKDFKDFEFLE
jgi:hypothetical protein